MLNVTKLCTFEFWTWQHWLVKFLMRCRILFNYILRWNKIYNIPAKLFRRNLLYVVVFITVKNKLLVWLYLNCSKWSCNCLFHCYCLKLSQSSHFYLFQQMKLPGTKSQFEFPCNCHVGYEFEEYSISDFFSGQYAKVEWQKLCFSNLFSE